ncbi:olfactory receptor 52K1-like [Hemicordylus capensis]|uniref:olfactory receptor 52K1-like n=1 Tax=Hemicordylus capensis TaxID=884348 RepID=UPI002302CD07|nr:olfactory receptor 52K1-like [Hemicordylus capensis]
MSAANLTSLHPSTFILVGIPGLEAYHVWISIPFCSIYILSLLGNFLLLGLIRTEPSLHEPMYLFLSMLAAADLVVSTTTLPKILSIFWFQNRGIHLHACLAQVFLIHSFSTMESGFFAAMAFDRYVAICNPLRHSAILTSTVTAKIGLVVMIRGAVLLCPHPILLLQLPYCRGNIIAHTYCEFMALVKLTCADTWVPQAYSLTVAFLTGGLDFAFIILSYILILRTVFQLPSKEARVKSLSTCGSHVCVILISYTPAFFSFLTHRFGHRVAPCAHIIVANIYVLIPPMMNPIIYGVKTKKIQESVLRILRFSSPEDKEVEK